MIGLMGRYQSKGGNRESEKENREKRDAQQCMIVDIRLGQDGQHVYGVAYQNGPIVERNVPEGRLVGLLSRQSLEMVKLTFSL